MKRDIQREGKREKENRAPVIGIGNERLVYTPLSDGRINNQFDIDSSFVYVKLFQRLLCMRLIEVLPLEERSGTNTRHCSIFNSIFFKALFTSFNLQ